MSAQSSASHSPNRSGDFSVSTKNMVKELAGEKCWACSAIDPDVCHVMAKEDTQVEVWLDNRLIDFPLTSMANAICLCAACHRQFDHWVDLGLIFFPEDLEYFIEYEKQDRKDRQRTGAQRTVPTADEYRAHQLQKGRVPDGAKGGLYIPVVIRSYLNQGRDIADPNRRELFLQLQLESVSQPKQWHGHPVASLRRAFHVLGSGRAPTAMSKLQLDQLRQLYDLYFAPLETDPAGAPEPETDPGDGNRGNRRNPKRDRHDEEEEEQAEDTTRQKPKRAKSANIQSTRTTRQSTRGGRHQHSEKVWCPYFKRWVTPYWTFGPDFTTEDVIQRLRPSTI